MASNNPQPGNTGPRMFAFENALDAISKVYTGENRQVGKLVDSFLDSARKIVADAGCFDSVGMQPKAECEEHWQAALNSLKSVHAILQTLNSHMIVQDWVEGYLVSSMHLLPHLPSL